MKKFFSVLMAAVLLMLPVSLSACSGGWQEVQSITYTTDTGSKTLTSKYEWNLIRDDISKEEYDKKVKEIEDNAKKENEEYVYNDLLNKGLDDAKVLKDEITRTAIISLINKDKDKTKISDDKKSIVGLKELIENYKKQAPHFFEKKASGYSPVDPEGDKGDGDGEVSMASNFAKRNNAEDKAEKSQFFD